VASGSERKREMERATSELENFRFLMRFTTTATVSRSPRFASSLPQRQFLERFGSAKVAVIVSVQSRSMTGDGARAGERQDGAEVRNDHDQEIVRNRRV
jgi:hypothetical protein